MSAVSEIRERIRGRVRAVPDAARHPRTAIPGIVERKARVALLIRAVAGSDRPQAADPAAAVNTAAGTSAVTAATALS